MPSVQNLLMLLSYLSLEFICRAFASILAPMSPMAFPLMSNLASVELLPSAFSTMDRSLFSLESARDREVRGWRVTRERERKREGCVGKERKLLTEFQYNSVLVCRQYIFGKEQPLIKHASGHQREFEGLNAALAHGVIRTSSSGILCDLRMTPSFTKCPAVSVCTLEWRCFVRNAKYPAGDSWEPALRKKKLRPQPSLLSHEKSLRKLHDHVNGRFFKQ